jgi:flavin-dependent thymidylate synthase
MANNTVELLGYYGSDTTHACSAWTSTSRELTEDKIKRIPALLKRLADDGHYSPFEKSSLHFLVNCDIASHIHIIKHRIGVSVNGESARYKEIKEDKYYIPVDWEARDIKASRGIELRHETITEKWTDILADYTKHGNKLYHECLLSLTPVLGRKRAKESARYFKTYNSQIQADVMFNFKSFSHFIKLRTKDDAQLEIQEIGKKMVELVKGIEGNPFEHTLKAFKL